MSSIDKLKVRIATKYKIINMFNNHIKLDNQHNSKDKPYTGFYVDVLNLIKYYPNLRNHGKRIRKFVYLDFDTNTRYTFFVMIVRVKDVNTNKVYDLLPAGVKSSCNYIYDSINMILDLIRNKKKSVYYIVNDLLVFFHHSPDTKDNCDYDIIYYWLSRLKDNESYFYRTFNECKVMSKSV